MFKFERELANKNIKYIAGVDEVGRGCLAGPMVVGAVILEMDDILWLDNVISHRRKGDTSCEVTPWPGCHPDTYNVYDSFFATLRNNDVGCREIEKYGQIKDSKLLSHKKREELSAFIKENAVSYSIEIVTAEMIDKLGITKCTQIAFFNAVKKLNVPPAHVLTDAFKIKVFPEDYQTNITRGDNVSITIAAASIVAKVFRDSLMVELHKNEEKYQKYGFDRHKGYGTKLHLEALKEYGPCDIHRRSFEPVKSFVNSL